MFENHKNISQNSYANQQLTSEHVQNVNRNSSNQEDRQNKNRQQIYQQQGQKLNSQSTNNHKKRTLGRGSSPADILIKKIFGSQNKFQEFNQLCQDQKRSICSNMIGKSDLYFQCFDCNKESQDTIICHSCFIQGQHTYHKVVYFNDMDDGGQCDCGDTSQKYPYFCDNHPLKKKETEHEKQRMLSLISPEIIQKITIYFEEEFIKIFKSLDTAKSGQYFSISQDIHQLLNSMIYLMNDRVPMIYLFSDLLTKHLDFQPASYEKHIQDKIVTINQSPYPSFLSKNKKNNKKKRTSKEVQDVNYQQLQSKSSTQTQYFQMNNSSMNTEEELYDSPFNLSTGSPVGLINRQISDRYVGELNQQAVINTSSSKGGFSIKNCLFNSVQTENESTFLPSPLVMIPITPSNSGLSGLNLWNNGMMLNNMSVLNQYQQQTALEQQIASIQTPTGIVMPTTPTPSISQNYINNLSEGQLQLNDQVSQPLQQSSNIINITSLSNIGDITTKSNQANPSFNTAPNTPYNGSMSMSQIAYPSPFFNPIGGLIPTQYALPTIASPFWTYSPYVSNQPLPTFANKIDYNFTLASNIIAQTQVQTNINDFQLSHLPQSNIIQEVHQQQQFNLPPRIQEIDQLPYFNQQSYIQESSLFAAPSPIQRAEQNLQINDKNMKQDQIKSYQENQNQNQKCDIFSPIQQRNNQQDIYENQKSPQIQDQNAIRNKQTSVNRGINIFKFLGSSKQSNGTSDSLSQQQNQQTNINQNQNQKEESESHENSKLQDLIRASRISFSQSYIQSEQEEQPKNALQKQEQKLGVATNQNDKKQNIFDEDENILSFSQFTKYPQKQVFDFPTIPTTPKLASDQTQISVNNQDGNKTKLSNLSSTTQQQPTQNLQNDKKWIDFPSIRDIHNSTQDLTKQQINTPQSNKNPFSQSDPKESPYQVGLTPFISSIYQNPEQNNNYLTKKLLNQLQNQTMILQNQKEINQQSITQFQLENTLKHSQNIKIDKNEQNKDIENNFHQIQQKSSNFMDEEYEDISQSPSKIDREDSASIYTQNNQQQIINQILKRRATLDINDILSSENQKDKNDLSMNIMNKKKQFIEEFGEQEKNFSNQNQTNIQNTTISEKNQQYNRINEKTQMNAIQELTNSSGTKSAGTIELEKEKWCLLELLFLYYPKVCNDQTDKSLQRVIMISFLDWSFRPLLVKLYTTYFDLIIETSKFEFYLWKICFQFFNESLESDFVINNTIMIEKVVKGMEDITKSLLTTKYTQSSNKRKILETMVQAFLQQKNAKYYGRSNRSIITLYLESLSQSDLLKHIDFDHAHEYLRFEAVLTRISQLINRNVKSIYLIDQNIFFTICKSIIKQIHTFISGKLFIEFLSQYSVPSVAHLKIKDDGKDAEKIYPFFNNKIRIFLIYFCQFYIESTSPPPSEIQSQINQPLQYPSSSSSSSQKQTNISSTLNTFLPNSQSDSNQHISQIQENNLGKNFDFYEFLKNKMPEQFPTNEQIDFLLINLAGYLTKALFFVDLKERNYDLNDPTAQLLAEEEGYENHNSELSLEQLYKSSKLHDYDFASLQFIFSLTPNNNLTLQSMWQAISSLVKSKENTQQQTKQSQNNQQSYQNHNNSQISFYDLTMDKILENLQIQQNLEFMFLTLCNICLNNISLLNALSPNQKLQDMQILLKKILNFFNKDYYLQNIIKIQHFYFQNYVSSWMKQSVEFAVIMSFFDKPLQDFYQIKENLKERFEINVQYLDLEGCVSKVAEWDENHKKFRLKREFQNMFEPYCAERNKTLSNDMYQTLKQQMERDLCSDLVLGNMLDFIEMKRCHHEKKNKRNIFSQNQSLILKNQNFMVLLSSICENLKEISAVNMNLAKHTLKLLQIIFLRCSIDRKNHQISNSNSQENKAGNQNSGLQQNGQNNNQNNNVNNLIQEDLMLFRLFVSNQKIKEQLTNYSVGKEDDLKRSTKKIINIFNAFQEIYQKENQIILMQIRRRNSSVDEENKKSEIKSQQQRIMEEFRKKQLNFLSKSSSNSTQNSQNGNKLTNNDQNSNITNKINLQQNNLLNQQKLLFGIQSSLTSLNEEDDNIQVSDSNIDCNKNLVQSRRFNSPPATECLICRTTSTEKSTILVIPCIFAHDSLFNYFLKESFCEARLVSINEQLNSSDQPYIHDLKNIKSNSQILNLEQNFKKQSKQILEIEIELQETNNIIKEENNQTQENNKIDTQDQSLLQSDQKDIQANKYLQKSYFSWSFTGCNHQVHSKCHHDVQQNLPIKTKARSSEDDSIHQNESFCAHCKSLLNIHLINIEYYLNTYDYSHMIERLNNPLSKQQQVKSLSQLQEFNIQLSQENSINSSNQADVAYSETPKSQIHETSKSFIQEYPSQKSFPSQIFINNTIGGDTGYLSLQEIIQEIKMMNEDKVLPKNLSDLIREDLSENIKIELESLLNNLIKEIKMVARGENIPTLFMKCAYFMSERYLNKDVISYIQKELPMCKAMVLNFTILLQLNPPSANIIASIKARLIQKLQNMTNLNELILKQIDKNDSIDEIFVEILFDVLFLGSIYHPDQQISEESKQIYEEKGRERPRDGLEWTFVIVTSLLKIIKMNVVVQVACLLHASTSTSFSQNSSLTLGFASILESIKSNSQFRASLFNMVRPFIQMLICFLLTVFPFSQTQLELLQKNILLDEDEYIHYGTILTKEFMTIDPFKTIQATGGEVFLKNFLKILQNQENQKKISKFFIHNPSREFKLVSLPLAYADFHKAFFFRKCSLCKDFPQTKGSDFHICLICGEVLCSFSCTPLSSKSNQHKGEKTKKNNHNSSKSTMDIEDLSYYQEDQYGISHFSDSYVGNLSKHALKMHCGKSAFLNIQRTTYILIDFPKAIQFHAKLFANRIGIPFLTGKPLIDWNKYFIDKKIIDHITQIIQDRQISQYMRHQLMIKRSDSSPITCTLMEQLP